MHTIAFYETPTSPKAIGRVQIKPVTPPHSHVVYKGRIFKLFSREEDTTNFNYALVELPDLTPEGEG